MLCDYGLYVLYCESVAIHVKCVKVTVLQFESFIMKFELV